MGPITYTFEELVAHKENADIPREVLDKLRTDADALLERPNVTVLNSKLPRPSGDVHDYVSVAPYFWPNPDTPDGLPWVGRDGYVNPDTRGVHPGSIYMGVHTLALAAFYLGDNGYSRRASSMLYDWFINPETKTNPNAKYAQSVPGVAEGRGAGLIEFSDSPELFNGIGILECMGLIDEKLVEGIKEWYVEFANWMLTHELGIRIDASTDNHASWYSSNLLSIATFTDRPALAHKIITEAYWRRTKGAIRPDGSQPEELRRTKGMGYSFYNLQAMFIYSNIAERRGYTEHWGIDSERGVCILKSAVDYLYPYVLDPKSFPYEELYPERQRPAMAKAMLTVAKRYPDEGYAERAKELCRICDAWCLEPII